jgi:hypothetical protein
VTRGGAAAAERDRCRLCGEKNACALEAGIASPCWCTNATFTIDALARAAAAGGAPRCICARCAKGESGSAAEGGNVTAS